MPGMADVHPPLGDEKKPGALRFLLARVRSVDLYDAVGIEVAVRIVPGIVEILHVGVVGVEGIGGDGTVGNYVAGVGFAVVMVRGAS